MISTGIESREFGGAAAADSERVLKTLRLPWHTRLTQVILRDGTDACNELVFEHEWLLHPNERGLALQGNLFVVAGVPACHETIILKTLPLPHARPCPSPADIRVRPVDDGYELDIVTSDPAETDTTLHILACDGGETERCRALQNFQRSLRPATPAHETPRALSNTWGDRNRDACLSEAFMLREIETAAILGIDVVQLDDGWQKGTTSNSVNAQTHNGVWEGYWDADPDFWTPHPVRFPNGLAPLTAAAARHGLSLGLWFSPDSSRDFANWQRDAQTLLRLHREHRVNHFKLDGIKIRSAAAQKNFNALIAAILDGSNGAIVTDLDVTAEVRPGYFGAIPAGILFVENRYTDWHRYWPHHTLRNLWKLSRWVDPRRLRMELPNPARNTEKYPSDPFAPAAYPPATLLATVLFANPLFWCELSNLPPACIDAWAPLMRLWREHRREIFSGAITPVGNAPDGVSWTGFLAANHLLVFRERSPAVAHTFPLPPQFANAAPRIIAGSGTAAMTPGGLRATLPEPLTFLWLRLHSP